MKVNKRRNCNIRPKAEAMVEIVLIFSNSPVKMGSLVLKSLVVAMKWKCDEEMMIMSIQLAIKWVCGGVIKLIVRSN